jgi:hypothetical protein
MSKQSKPIVIVSCITLVFIFLPPQSTAQEESTPAQQVLAELKAQVKLHAIHNVTWRNT